MILIEARDRLKLHDRLGEHGGGKWGLAAADVINLPFKDDYFDLVICSEVLEHIVRHRTAIRGNHQGIETGQQSCRQRPQILAGAHLLALSTERIATSAGGHVRIFKQTELVADLEACRG